MTVNDLKERFEATGHLPVIYLSGPMSGRPNHNFDLFNDVARKLRLVGFPVLNPADFGHGRHPWGLDKDGDHEEWVRCLTRDLPMVAAADVVVMLEGYERSRGARLEHNAAVAYRKPIVVHGDGHLVEFLLNFLDKEEFDRLRRADVAAEAVRALMEGDRQVEQVVVILRDPPGDDDADEGPDRRGPASAADAA